MIYEVKTRLLILKHPEVYPKKDMKSVIRVASRILLRGNIKLFLEEVSSVFDYTPMQRGDDRNVSDWLHDFGSHPAHGFWYRQERLLQVLLAPPLKDGSTFRPTFVTGKTEDLDQLWCVATASPVINTLCSKGDPVVTSAVMIARAVAGTLGATPSVATTPNVMSPCIELWGEHTKDLSFTPDSIKQVRSWFSGKKFPRVG